MNKQNEVIKTVQSMLNEESFISKDELLVKTQELGWKPVTLNFALKKLKELGVLIESNEDGDKMYKLGQNEYPANKKSEKNMGTPGYRTRRSNYKREIKELTPEQEDFKQKVNNNRDELFGKKIIWEDGNGMKFPLTIAGMGDITLRCRFFLADFLESEPQTGALVYIPWDDGRISQLFDQVDELLSPKEEIQECVNFMASE